MRAAGAPGVAVTSSRYDHQHAAAVIWDAGNVDNTSPASNVRANRSANSGTVRSAGTGITQFGSDTTGTAAGAQANYSTITGGDAGGIEQACTYAAVINGTGAQIKDDPAPGTKLLPHSVYACTVEGKTPTVTGSDYSFVVGGDNSSITGSPCSLILGGLERAVLFGIANVITGSGIDAGLAGNYSYGNAIVNCDGSSILGNKTAGCAIVGVALGTVGTAGSVTQVTYSCILGGLAGSVKSGNYCAVVGGQSCVIGADTLSNNSRCATLGGSALLIGTVTSGCINCVSLGGAANAIQAAATNSFSLGGASNTATATVRCGFVGCTSSTIGSGSTCTDCIIHGANSAVIGSTFGCTSSSILGGGTGGGTQSLNGCQNCGIGFGRNNSITGTAANQVLSAAILSGTSCTIGNAARATIANGSACTIATGGDGGFVGSGATNAIGAFTNCCIVAGNNNATGAQASGVLCGIGSSTYLATQICHASGYTTSQGERQESRIIVRGNTPGSGANESVSALFGSIAGNPLLAITPADTKSYAVEIRGTIVKSTDAAISGSFFLQAQVYKKAGAVTVNALAAVPAPAAFPAGLTGATMALTASGGNLVLTFTTGAGNTTATRCAATIDWIEALAG